MDFDNDGRRDLFIACGHIDDNVELRDDTTSYLARCVLLRNTGEGQFVNVTDQAGNGLTTKRSHRGTAFEDLDNDGRIDVVMLNSRSDAHGPAQRIGGGQPLAATAACAAGNQTATASGLASKVVAGDLTTVDEIHSGRGYQSHYGSRLHFGLGTRQKVDRVEIQWVGRRSRRASRLGDGSTSDDSRRRSHHGVAKLGQVGTPSSLTLRTTRP